MVGKGAWCIRFSHDGKVLAVACSDPPIGSSIRDHPHITSSLRREGGTGGTMTFAHD